MTANIAHLKGEGSALSHYDDVYELMRAVHRASKGRYPALEWASGKPPMSDPDYWSWFDATYAPFLRMRLEPLDESYLLTTDGQVLGYIGLIYDWQNKDDDLLPLYQKIFERLDIHLESETAGMLELLVVHPEHWRQGYGEELLKKGIERFRELGRIPYGVTFPDLAEAHGLYEKLDWVNLGTVTGFAWEDGDAPGDYLLLRF